MTTNRTTRIILLGLLAVPALLLSGCAADATPAPLEGAPPLEACGDADAGQKALEALGGVPLSYQISSEDGTLSVTSDDGRISRIAAAASEFVFTLTSGERSVVVVHEGQEAVYTMPPSSTEDRVPAEEVTGERVATKSNLGALALPTDEEVTAFLASQGVELAAGDTTRVVGDRPGSVGAELSVVMDVEGCTPIPVVIAM